MSWELFIKNTGLRKVVRQNMGADACPVPEGQGSWLETSVSKLTTEAPVNGGRNYDGQLLGPSLKKTICWNSHADSSSLFLCFEESRFFRDEDAKTRKRGVRRMLL